MDRYNGPLSKYVTKFNFLQVIYEISKNKIWRLVWAMASSCLLFLQFKVFPLMEANVHTSHTWNNFSFNQGYVTSLDWNFYKEN
jgi:hypothetical protein